MMKCKNNLDEMQEQKLLKIEHRGFWIIFFGLILSIYIQIAMGNSSFKYIGTESIIILIVSFYFLVDCIRNGIWDRHLKPNLKTNIGISLLTGILVGCFWFVVSYHNYHALVGSIMTFIFMFIFVSIITLSLLIITSSIYKYKKHKLDKKADIEENEQ